MDGIDGKLVVDSPPGLSAPLARARLAILLSLISEFNGLTPLKVIHNGINGSPFKLPSKCPDPPDAASSMVCPS